VWTSNVDGYILFADPVLIAQNDIVGGIDYTYDDAIATAVPGTRVRRGNLTADGYLVVEQWQWRELPHDAAGPAVYTVVFPADEEEEGVGAAPAIAYTLERSGKFKLVHVLVALSHLGECPIGLDRVNHRNSCRLDCSVSNLEYTDARGNVLHMLQQGVPPQRTATPLTLGLRFSSDGRLWARQDSPLQEYHFASLGRAAEALHIDVRQLAESAKRVGRTGSLLGHVDVVGGLVRGNVTTVDAKIKVAVEKVRYFKASAHN
jgi:hypothetical protein